MPGSETILGHLRIADYINLVISLAILVTLLKIFNPLKAIITFYLATLVKVGKVPGREQYLDHLIAVGDKLTILIYLVVLYPYFAPIILKVNYAFLGFNELKTFLAIGGVIFGLYILVMLWINAQPLIEIFTGKLADKVASASTNIAYIACPFCGTKNDLDAGFCVSC